jgi:16S rRNA (guanine527-N7)-methyltransferase
MDLDERQVELFMLYTDLLVEWNDKINLTRITDPEQVVTKHFIDSLTALKAIRPGTGDVVADVGTGAGFPGVPIAIARTEVKVVLIDATLKRLGFLDEVRNQLDLKNTELVHARAEEAGRLEAHRERYNFVVARAVAEMRILSEYCLPLVKVGGVFLAMKGPDIEEELAEARPVIGQLGGGHPELVRLVLPESDIKRTLVTIRKLKPTPEQYPRHGAKIVKR